MDKDALTSWALANGWQMIAGCPSLTKPRSPKEAIVRLVFKATVVNVEVKKPAGKWEKVSGLRQGGGGPDTGMPGGLGLTSIPGFTMLMQDNKDRLMMQRLSGAGGSRAKAIRLDYWAGFRDHMVAGMCNDYRTHVDLDTIPWDFSKIRIRIRLPEGAPNLQLRDGI